MIIVVEAFVLWIYSIVLGYTQILIKKTSNESN